MRSTDSKPKKQIYIVPTRFGFFYAAIVLTFMLLAVHFQIVLSSSPAGGPFLVVIAFLITVGLVSMLLTHSNVAAIEVRPVRIESGFTGEKTSFVIEISNPTSNPIYSIEIQAQLFDLEPFESKTVTILIPVTKRGMVNSPDVSISSLYPLGLFYCWFYQESQLSAFAYPLRRPIVPDHLNPTAGNGDRPDDSIAHRNPTPGDSPFRIDWNLYARSGVIQIKAFEDSLNKPVELSLASVPGSPIEEKLSHLSWLISHFSQKSSPFSLKLGAQNLGMGSGSKHAQSCLEALATYEVTHEKSPLS